MELNKFNEIKKGQKIKFTFESAIRKNQELILVASGKPRSIKSPWAKSRVILKKEGSNFKYYLYLSKKDKISLAIGNLATSNLKINNQ